MEFIGIRQEKQSRKVWVELIVPFENLIAVKRFLMPKSLQTRAGYLPDSCYYYWMKVGLFLFAVPLGLWFRPTLPETKEILLDTLFSHLIWINSLVKFTTEKWELSLFHPQLYLFVNVDVVFSQALLFNVKATKKKWQLQHCSKGNAEWKWSLISWFQRLFLGKKSQCYYSVYIQVF